MNTSRSSKRDKLLKSAIDLFNENGFHATGIDEILRVSGVAKKTLYNHFRSKDDLVLAALRRYDEEFRHWFVAKVESLAKTPMDRLLAVFDVAQIWFCTNQFHGCMFINAAGEFPDEQSAVRVFCKEFKRLVKSYIESLVRSIGVTDPNPLTRQLCLLFEGAIVTAQVSNTSSSADDAKQAARVLIECALHSNNSTR